MFSSKALYRLARVFLARYGGKGSQYHFQHAFRVLQNVIVPKPQHLKALRPQPRIAPTIPRILSMLSAIKLDDQLSVQARKIDDVRPDRHLTFEFVA